MEEIKHTIEFGKETLSVLNSLTKAINENNKLLCDGNPNEFAREVCANIYADLLIDTLFPKGFNKAL